MLLSQSHKANKPPELSGPRELVLIKLHLTIAEPASQKSLSQQTCLISQKMFVPRGLCGGIFTPRLYG